MKKRQKSSKKGSVEGVNNPTYLPHRRRVPLDSAAIDLRYEWRFSEGTSRDVASSEKVLMGSIACPQTVCIVADRSGK